MKDLHSRLMDKSRTYALWHSHPHHQKAHWAALIASLLVFSLVISGSGYDVSQAQNVGEVSVPPASKGLAKGYAEYEVLVKLKNSDTTTLGNLKVKYGLTEKSDIPALGIKVFSTPKAAPLKWWQKPLQIVGLVADRTPPGIAKQLNKNEKSSVEFAEVNHKVEPSLLPNDALYSKQWALPKIGGPAAWDTTTGSADVTIAILDTGVNPHVELASKMVPGWNTYDNNNNTTDVYGHGTGVAGVATAISNNTEGVASVSWQTKLMPIRISDTSGYGYSSTVAAGLTWAADHGARVANVSYIMDGYAAVKSAAKYFMSKGGVVTMSAGNYSTVYNTGDNPDILVASATDSTDAVTSWSNTGTNVDIAAPGASIYSAFWTGGYGTGSGTSYSAPIVAGAAALVMSANPSLTAAQVRDILKESALDLGTTGTDSRYGAGRLDVANAITTAINSQDPGGDTVAPTAPTNLVASANDSTKVNLTWAAATDNIGVTAYTIYRDSVALTNVTALTYVDTAITAARTYNYTVKATDAAGNASPASNTSTVTVPDTVVPSVPSNFRSTSVTETSAGLAWNASTDNVGVTGYRIYRDGAIVTTTGNTTYTDPNLTTATTYIYTVAAVDGAGNQSNQSSALTITTTAAGGGGGTADTTAPSISITSPANNAKVSGNLTVTVNATDNIAITKVELYVDGTLTNTSTASPFNIKWNTAKVSKGAHTLQAKAYDAAGNVGTSPIISVTK